MFKNKVSKKILPGIMGLSALLLIACGDSDSGEAPTNEDGDTIITLGQRTEANNRLPEGDTYSDNAYRRVVKEEMGIELQSLFEATGGENLDQQRSLAITSNEIPDYMVVGRDEFEELAENEMIADLTEVFEEYASDYIKEIYAGFDNLQLEAATIDDRLMALPGTGSDFGPNLVWIRQDYLDILDIELDPDGNGAITLEELEDTARAFLENDPGDTGNPRGFAFPHWLVSGDHGGSGYTATPIFNAFGAFPNYTLEDESGTLYDGETTEETRDALEYLNGLFEDGLLDSQFGTRTYDDIEAMMINGELGIIPGPWHMPDWGLIQAKSMNPDAEFVPYALESVNGDGSVNAIDRPVVGGYVVVREGFQHPEMIIELFNFFFDYIPNEADLETEFPELYEYEQVRVDGSVHPLDMLLLSPLSEISDAIEATQGAEGEIEIDDIDEFIVRNNALSMRDYMDDPDNAEGVDWSMYLTRNLAVAGVMNGVRESGIINEVNPPVIEETIRSEERSGGQINDLREITFINFVTGEEPIENFDNFVEEYLRQGGADILEEKQEIMDERD